MGTKNITVNGGQAIFANDNAVVNVTQNNGIAAAGELNGIFDNIMRNLSDLKKEDAEQIKDIVDMVKEELQEPEPKASRLKNCVALIKSMLAIVSGVPDLVDSLQKLLDYILPYIQ